MNPGDVDYSYLREPARYAGRDRQFTGCAEPAGRVAMESTTTVCESSPMTTTTTTCPDSTGQFSLRFTFRHLLILVAYLVVLFYIVLPALAVAGRHGPRNVLVPVVLITPPLAALLVMIFERAGPLKNWCVLFLNVLFFPAVVLNHDCVALLTYLHRGRPPVLWVTVVLNVAAFAYLLKYSGRILPRRCPGCRRWTLIPLIRLFKQENRSVKTSWCASCGGKFWKDHEGVWRPERRTTWLDALERSEAAKTVVAPPPNGPTVSAMTHRPHTGRAVNEVQPS
jgi:hypothetical protein